jgi:riboflavin biosynthesis pyrimidine reductase
VRRLLPEPAGPIDPVAAYADLPAPAGRPGVRLNMVSSIDGAIAVDGLSGGLGGPADHRVFMALRSLCDVVVVAAGTVRAEGYGPVRLDAALVSARRERGQATTPRIAVVSRSLALDWDGPLFAGAPSRARPIVVTCAAPGAAALRRARAVAEVVVAGEESVDVPAALVELGARGLARVLAEGGPRLNASLADAGVLDEVCLTVSPRLVGGDARRILDGPEGRGVDAMRLRSVCEDEGLLFLRWRASSA